MVNDLGLTGDELTVFAILWGFSQDGSTASRTPKQYFMEWTGKGSDATIRTIKSLIKKGLIERICRDGKTPEYRCKIRPLAKYDPSQNAEGVMQKCDPYPSQNATPINKNNINNIINRETRAREEQIKSNELFEKWFALYGINNQRGGCYEYWNSLTPSEQAQVINHTKRYKEVAVSPLQPYAYLVTFQKWRAEKKTTLTDEQPEVEMVTVETENGYKTVSRDEAIKNGWRVI